MSNENTKIAENTEDTEGTMTLRDWIGAPLIEFDHTERVGAELQPLIDALVEKADEIGVPIYIAVQVLQDQRGAGYNSAFSWTEPGQLSGGMLALQDALFLNLTQVANVFGAQSERVLKLRESGAINVAVSPASDALH